MDLIYGLPQELLDDWYEDSEGVNYSVAKLRVIDSDTATLLAETITNQAQLIDLLLKDRDTQQSILVELKKVNVYINEGMGFKVKETDTER